MRSPSTACGRPVADTRAYALSPCPPLAVRERVLQNGQLGSGAVRLGPASPWHLFKGGGTGDAPLI